MRIRILTVILISVLMAGFRHEAACGDAGASSEYGAVFDFGVIETASEVKHSFVIPNKRSDVLRVSRVVSSCDCLHILSYPDEIPAGGSGKLEIRLIPSQAGDVTHEVSVETESDPPLRYEVKGLVKGEISKIKKDKIPADFFTRRVRKRDAGLAISVENVLEKKEAKRDVLLVDVRDEAEFERFSIPGSINVPLFALKTKTFLKSRPLVLVDRGDRYRQLEEQCKELRGAGFSVSILNGGLNRWRSKGARIEGDPFAQTELNKVPPQVFHAEREYENWVIVDISQPPTSDGSYLIPQAIRVPFNRDPERFIPELKAAIGKRTKEPLLFILICDEKGENYGMLEPAFQKSGMDNIYYLAGGIEAYRGFARQQVAIWKGVENKTDKKVISTGRAMPKCPTCPK
ncbi:MAG: rhodanese-like domain-containing protein [Pseudomonadota bacterium]